MILMSDDLALLSAYADGELDEAATLQVESYLAVDAMARDTVEMHREVGSLLRAALSEVQYARKTDRMPVARRREPRPIRFVWAAAASILLAVVGFGAGAMWPDLLTSERESMLTEIALYHSVYSRETVHLVEVPAAQADHLKMWLGKRVNRDLVIPDFKEAGLTFAGGRLVVLDGSPVAELMYTRENGLPIAFCVLSHSGKQRMVQVEQKGKVNLANWDDGSHSYVVVGEANSEMILGLADMARKQL
jgi:anti-sigma factor RsiW